MRKIETTSSFKRDFKREAKGQHRAVLDTELKQVITALANDLPLAAKYRDHPLSGIWRAYRDCHVRPDLVLIYQLANGDGQAMQDKLARLILVRLGSHSELDL